jgi:GntR family transcriptional regulator, transcriptional repressor for pyruvate dehydrogenase complex
MSGGLRRPRMADVVAEVLRDRILSGEVGDGDAFPKQEQLLEEFRVSKPAIREALAILELEGLVSVRRGNVGGAVVRLPSARDAAYMVGLVLQSQEVNLADIGVALASAEGMCASQAAERADRKREVVPRLRRIHKEAVAALGQEPRFTLEARRFHEELVQASGNATMVLIVGLLEALWAAHERRSRLASPVVDPEVQQAGLDAHERIIDCISRGDGDAALRETRLHATTRVHYVTGVEPAGY